MDMPLRFCRLLCLGALCVGAAASAQTLKLSFPSGEDTFFVKEPRTACASTPQVSINWEFNSASRRICTKLRVWATAANSCTGTEPGAEDVQLYEAELSAVDSGTIRPQDMSQTLGNWPAFKKAGNAACGTEGEKGIRYAHSICGGVSLGDSNSNCGQNSEKATSKELTVIYKTSLPPKPTPEGEEEDGIVKVKGYDGQAEIRFSASGDDVDEVVLYESDGTPRKERMKVSAGSSLSVDGLEDGIPSKFFLKAVDKAGNESPPSSPIEVTTAPTQGFWDLYKQAGGTSGGCQTGPGSLAGLALALVGFGIARRLC